MKLGKWLEETNRTAGEFAADLGVDQSSVSRYVSGERVPRPHIIMKITTATDGQVTANDFMPPPDIDGDVNAAPAAPERAA